MIVSGKQRITNALLPFYAFETVEKLLSLLLVQFKFRPDRGRVAAVEAVFGELLLLHQADIPISLIFRPAQVVDALYTLKKRADAFEPVGEFHGDGVEVNPAALLEVGELGDLQAIQKNLPADAPRT